MTELEIMKRAKSYIDQLARGIDPISGDEVPDDSVLNQERLFKCFTYVSGKLEESINIEAKKQAPKSNKKFIITQEQIQQVPVSDEPITINPFCEIITDIVGNTERKPLGGTIVTEWLEEQGYLQSIKKERGGIKRIATEKGNGIGIVTQG